jgi:DNA invertase Pin-like site-specific DNA recombinase
MSRRKLTSATPTTPTYVAYYRVSTERQGRSGLGLEAQRVAVERYLGGISNAFLAAKFTDVESGKRSDRPELVKALELCRATGATLIVAKLDRLSRDVDFLRQCVREIDDAGVVFCDLPDLPPGAAGKLVLTVMASIAEFEAGRISERTKAALAAAKARGVKLGNPKLRAGDAEMVAKARAARTRHADDQSQVLQGFITKARKAGAGTLQEVAAAMMALGIRTPSGGSTWHPSTVLGIERRVRAFPVHELRMAA